MLHKNARKHNPKWRPYRRVAGAVEGAKAMWNQPPPLAVGRTVAQRQGLRFERKVLESLMKSHPHFIDHLPFIYLSNGRQRAAIPDGVCFSRSLETVTIIEIKHRHSEEGWQQLNLLYKPVVARAFPKLRIKLLEIVRWYEPHIKLPDKAVKLLDPVSHFDSEDFDYGIHIWLGDAGE